MAAPLFWRGDTIGVLNFEHTQLGVLSRFDDLVKTLADHAAFSIYNLKTLDRLRLLSYDESIASISAFARTVRHNLEPRFRDIVKFTSDSSWKSDTTGLAGKIRDEAIKGLHEADDLVELAPHLAQPAGPIKPVYILRTVLESYREKLKLEIVQECDDQVTVAGRQGVLVFCFKQVLQNSHKYGATRVKASMRRCPNPAGQVDDLEIILSDNGPGLPKSVVHELFATERRHLEPTGRGEALILCRLYLRHMGGSIDGDVVEPHGIAITVRLPILKEE